MKLIKTASNHLKWQHVIWGYGILISLLNLYGENLLIFMWKKENKLSGNEIS